jgi:uncharacterized protein (DUF849 family)
MNHDVFITCAITGDDTNVTKSPHCPITPEQIATAAVDAANAGAAIERRRGHRAHPRA